MMAILVRAVRGCLSDDLRSKQYQGHPNPYTGHCYVACEALYHLLGGKDAGLTPVVMRVDGGTHWWLRTKDGQVVDPTVEQFDTVPDYSQGRPCGFLTKQPSKRAQQLIERIKTNVDTKLKLV